ncbi:MAG: pyridoxamine 5'-phosphate oxidase family protein [Spirochaetaceae bacterium]|nr:MAG: pyridoxamine 5'-phosphate oxidase family protein [Spirochaetaceae bacterium]
MRRREKEIRNQQVLEELLRSAPVCRIGLAPAAGDAGAEDYPFVVPVHFAHASGRIYIHCARTGRKIDMLTKNPRVCLEIDEYLGLKAADKACDYGTRFRSLIAFGRARIVAGTGKKRRALQLLMEKYAGRGFDLDEREIERVGIIEIRLEEVTGKQG